MILDVIQQHLQYKYKASNASMINILLNPPLWIKWILDLVHAQGLKSVWSTAVSYSENLRTIHASEGDMTAMTSKGSRRHSLLRALVIATTAATHADLPEFPSL